MWSLLVKRYTVTTHIKPCASHAALLFLIRGDSCMCPLGTWKMPLSEAYLGLNSFLTDRNLRAAPPTLVPGEQNFNSFWTYKEILNTITQLLFIGAANGGGRAKSCISSISQMTAASIKKRLKSGTCMPSGSHTQKPIYTHTNLCTLLSHRANPKCYF